MYVAALESPLVLTKNGVAAGGWTMMRLSVVIVFGT